MFTRERISRQRAGTEGGPQPSPVALTWIVLVGLVLACGDARATTGRDAAPRRLSLGVLTGATGFDRHLADYEWNVTPRAGWGVQALAGQGRVALGARVWSASTTQTIEFADVTHPSVRVTTIDLIGRGQLVSRWGLGLDATGSAGRIHLGYRPDHVVVSPSGGGTQIGVDLKPVNEWSAGAGLALRRSIAGPWSASVEIERQMFGMKTAHRDGGAIVVGRESFGDWSARLELARVVVVGRR